MAHTFDSGGASDLPPIPRQFIITPEKNCNTIFLCLKLIPEDTDIQWLDQNNNVMFGRHIDINSEQARKKVTGTYTALNNILENIPNAKNIAVWGRSEQLIAINGEEIKIGPSGYYELKLNNKNINIDSLCIANTLSTDKYIVDVQYIQNS